MSRIHFFINHNETGFLLLKKIPCADCDFLIRPDQKSRASDKPVPHAFQTATCPQCGSSHIVISAATKEDCIALEPVMAQFKKSVKNSF